MGAGKQTASRWAWCAAIGPGILAAGAAIGVSHVVQSTRAGAEYGLSLIGLVLVCLILKYPFFEAGHRYTVATGETLLDGYKRLGQPFLLVFLALNAFTAVISIAGVTFVTAILTPRFGVADGLSPATMAAGLLILAIGLIAAGRYKALDLVVKVMMGTLFLATVTAFVIAITGPKAAAPDFSAPSPWTLTALPFLIALLGWMPAPIELSVWQSLWIRARERGTDNPTTRKQAAVDFHLGYVMTMILAVMFITLGAWVMFGTGQDFASGSAGFTQEFVALYTAQLGSWTAPLIAAAAFFTMLSTTLTLIDAYPRSLSVGLQTAFPQLPGSAARWHLGTMVVAGFIGWLIIAFSPGAFTTLIDWITTIAFLTAPVFAFLNFRLVYSKHLPATHRPPRWHFLLSVAGMIFLVGFSGLFLWTKLF